MTTLTHHKKSVRALALHPTENRSKSVVSAIRMRVAATVQANSASTEEARKRTFEFFKSACRSLPSVMEIYNLHDVVTISQLRSTISSSIRNNAHISNPKVIDMLLFKGTEELTNIVDHAKQRHHIIGQYVVGCEALCKDSGRKDHGGSDFLKKFHESNYL